jgi:uncharacterized membrane protein
MKLPFEQGHEPNFRWRGKEVARIEGLCDGVFAFAITLLVVSLEVPKTYDDLMHAMRGFLAFALSFALLFQLWHSHHRFFRRYGLQDVTTQALSGALLFVVLFFTYPLKFLFGFLQAEVFGDELPPLTLPEARVLMFVYGAGFVAVFLVMALLHLHALRRREVLELDDAEILLTLQSLRANGLMVFVGALSLIVASTGAVSLAGFVYFLCPIVQTVNGIYTDRRMKEIPGTVA